MQVDNSFLGKEPVGRLLFKLALPTIAAQVVNMLYNLVDRFFIGHMPGDSGSALTGVGVCFPLIMIISAFAALIGSGGAPRASILMGKGDKRAAESTMGACFTALLLFSLALTAVLLIWHRNLLLLFGASKDTIGAASDYMLIYSLGTVFVQLTLGMNAYITAQGFAKQGMITVLVGAVANIALDPLFIYVFKMGVKGAAVATVIAQALSCVWVLAFLFSKKSVLRLSYKKFSLKSKLLLPCIALGVAPFVMQASESVISIAFNTSLRDTAGDVAVGSMTILTSVMQFAMLPMQGLAQGAQPIASYNYGARQADRVKRVFWLLLGCSLIYSFTVWAVVMLFPNTVASLLSNNAAIVDYAASMLRIYCAVLCIFGAQIACQMTFVSLGKALSSMIVAIMRKFVLILPLIYIMPAIFTRDKAVAIFAAEPVADIIAVSFTVILFAFQFRAAIKKISAPR